SIPISRGRGWSRSPGVRLSPPAGSLSPNYSRNIRSAGRVGARRRGRGSAPAASPTRLNRRPAGGAQASGVPLRRSAPPPPPPPAPMARATLVRGLGSRLGRSARAELARADLHRLHVELVFDAVQDLVADLAAVPQADDAEPLRVEGLVAEPSEGARIFQRALAVIPAQGRSVRPPLRVARAELLEMRGAGPRLAGELLQAVESRLYRRIARAQLFVGQGGVLAGPEAGRGGGQGQSLEHEGHDDHAEGEKDDVLAEGEGRAARRGQGEGEGGGEGDDAAHADPAHEEDARPLGRGVAAQGDRNEARKADSDGDPDHAYHDGDHADHRRLHDERPELAGAHRGAQGGEL